MSVGRMCPGRWVIATAAMLAIAVALAPAPAGAGIVTSRAAADARTDTIRASDASRTAAEDGVRTAADSARAAGPGSIVAAPPERSPLVDDLWVVRTSLLSPADIPRIITAAESMGVHGLLVQVVGRGDAYYRSDLLPRAEALPGSRDASFDPLGDLLTRAHAAGLQVHAWVNCLLVWSAPQRPSDPRHVVNAHPEWIARTRDGRKLSEYRARERRRLGLEGVFLAPAHPGVRTWLARVVKEIVERYPVDGVHLDYIRQPGVPVGFDPTTRARFALESGVDPRRIALVPAGRRAEVNSEWASFQRAQVTATVREVRDSIERTRPGVALSAAVLADTLAARNVHAQPWTEWVREGLLDRAYAMCYAPTVQTVMDQLVGYSAEFGALGRVVPGIAVYNTSPALAAAKILGARSLGFPRLALYSYDSLEQSSGYWHELRGRLEAAAQNGRP